MSGSAELDPERFARLESAGWAELRQLWMEIERGTTPGWRPGEAMEHLVLRAFELGGAEVRRPYHVSYAGGVLEQIDGAIHVGDTAFLVECKDVRDPTGVDPIAKLRNQLLRRPAGVVGVLFSRAGFTDAALTLAQHLAPQSVLLWEGREVADALSREQFVERLILKRRYSIEEAVPDYGRPARREQR